ncbi:MAG: serine/threonine-protein kinase [Planctomycetota bacterium]
MTDSWLDWLARDGWLDPAQFDQARQIAETSSTPSEFAASLTKLRLITAFQSKLLLAGQAQRLDCGRYRIRKLLGRGGMGEVYAAEPRDRRDIPIAVKVLQIDSNLPDEDRKRLEARFLREMKAGRKVEHPNVTKTVDFGRDSDRLYLVMPRLRGPSFAALIEAKNRRPELKTVVRLAAQVNQGLIAIHAAGLVHRDLKPSNIVYDGYKRWKILDLGLAKAIGDRQSLTRPGVILGTLDYASPEQLRDASKVDSSADYYSLGCILFHALSGHVPFDGGDAVSKIYRHRMTPPESLAVIRPDLPDALSMLVDQLLQKNPADRPSGSDVALCLNILLEGRPSGSSQSVPILPDQPTSPLPEPSSSDSFVVPQYGELSSESGLGELMTDLGEHSPDDLAEDDWSEPIAELDQASRYVQTPVKIVRKSSKRSPSLEFGLQVGLILTVLFSLLIFLWSLRAFLDPFLA